MAAIVFPQRFACRRDTPANWVSANPVLWIGEIGFEIEAGQPLKMKAGNGVDAWNDLDYFTPGTSAFGAIGATFDGGGDVLASGAFVDVMVPYDCEITAATILADQVGDIELSVLAGSYASFPPATDIAPGSPPTITGSDRSQDSSLSGWSTSIVAGTVLRIGIVSCSAIERATFTLKVTRT